MLLAHFPRCGVRGCRASGEREGGAPSSEGAWRTPTDSLEDGRGDEEDGKGRFEKTAQRSRGRGQEVPAGGGGDAECPGA